MAQCVRCGEELGRNHRCESCQDFADLQIAREAQKLMRERKQEREGGSKVVVTVNVPERKLVEDLLADIGRPLGPSDLDAETGFILVRICPICGHTHAHDEKFCRTCGRPLSPKKKKCEPCGKIIPVDSNFCPYCGKKQTKTEDK